MNKNEVEKSNLPSNAPYQQRVMEWAVTAFGEVDALNTVMRRHRFMEEALELAQSLGADVEEIYQLVAYVFGRPRGEMSQEIGGTLVTLACLAEAWGVNMNACAEVELERCWQNIKIIRRKHASKPQFGPLPVQTDDLSANSERVNHPAHYGGEHNIYEAIKVIDAWKLGFSLGNAVKYISRAGKKVSAEFAYHDVAKLEDLKKARWYLDHEIQMLEQSISQLPVSR